MTLTLPTIAPTGYSKDVVDFSARTKVDRSGAVRVVTGSVSVPAATATNTVIGLVPFNKGCKLGYGARIYTGDVDSSTNVTYNIGYTYYDSTLGTTDADAFVAASTTPQTGGMIEMTAVAGMTWTAEADGWFTVVNTAATTTTGTITFNLPIAYDASGVTNA